MNFMLSMILYNKNICNTILHCKPFPPEVDGHKVV
jgi:hypothetical protein